MKSGTERDRKKEPSKYIVYSDVGNRRLKYTHCLIPLFPHRTFRFVPFVHSVFQSHSQFNTRARGFVCDSVQTWCRILCTRPSHKFFYISMVFNVQRVCTVHVYFSLLLSSFLFVCEFVCLPLVIIVAIFSLSSSFAIALQLDADKHTHIPGKKQTYAQAHEFSVHRYAPEEPLHIAHMSSASSFISAQLEKPSVIKWDIWKRKCAS